MKNIVLRLSGGIGVALAILLVIGWLVLRASLPQLDGKLRVAGLSAAASIARDASGIPVISAQNRSDLAFATGFVHAQDRLFQMDLIRRKAAGELSELVGRATLDIDKRVRLHRFRSRAKEVLAALPADDLAILQHYADGVNAGRESLRARPFEYFVLGTNPAPWQPEDSILVVYAMFLDLNDSRASKDVRRGRARTVLPVEVYDWIYPVGTPWDAPLMGLPRERAPIPGADVVSLRGTPDEAPPSNEQGRYPLRGSNNWAVSGALTDSGRAIVSNDMHLGLSAPNIYYRARLVVNGREPVDVAGVTIPGTPLVVAGSNTRVAWAYTNSYGDYADAIVLEPGLASDTYRTPDGDRQFSSFKEVIQIKSEDSVEYTVRDTIWGPVLDDTDYPDGEVAVSWIAHKPDAINLNLLRLESAATAREALDIATTVGMPPQNFVTGDAEGNIGWTIAGKIPAKSEFDAMVPGDWSAQQGWNGWVAAENYPRIDNPASGRIWTANARVTDAEALAIVGDGGYDLGARAQQIRDTLFAKSNFTPEDMLRIQYDDRALFLARWRGVLLDLLDDEIVANDKEMAEYRRQIENWIPRAVPESVGYRLVRAFHLEIERRLFYALTAPVRDTFGADVGLRKSNQFEAPLWSAVSERPMHLLPADYDDWDEFLLQVVRDNIRYYAETFDGPLADRRWGEINTAAIRHPLSRGIPVFGKYLDMPADPLNGDLDMPKAQGPEFGAAERFSVVPGDEANSLLHMPTGASGHPLSEYYGKGHGDWVAGLPSPFLPGKAVHTLTLSPDKR